LKVGEIVVQYPTNVYPENIAFDSTVLDCNNTISFKFNGDILTGALYNVFDYNTGELVLTKGYVNQLRTPIAYNGRELKMTNGFLNDLDNGKDYAMQIMVLQWQSDGTTPLCDMFVLRGQTQENYLTTDNTIITIEDKISSIYEWEQTTSEGWRNNSVWVGVVVTSCELVIGEERRHIVAYQETTGKAVLSSALPNNIPAGTKYQIYCNYKVSPLYFFKCRSEPVVDLDLVMIDHGTRGDEGFGFRVSGIYNQSEGSLINYYKLKLYWNWKGDNSIPWRLIDETDNIYSQQIEYEFFDDFILRYKKRVHGAVIDVSATEATQMFYKVVIDIVTADGMTFSKESNILFNEGVDDSCPVTEIQKLLVHNNDKPDVFYSRSIDNDVNAQSHNLKHMVHIIGGISPDSEIKTFPEGTKYTYYRENLYTGEIRLLETADDITVPTKGKYRYYEVPRKLKANGIGTTTYLKGISYRDIEINSSIMNGYTITELILRDEDYQWGTKPRYKIGNQWKFVGEVQDTTITQNLDRVAHVGYGVFPIITSTKTNYLSGTLSAMNGYVDCTTKTYKDDIDLIRAWRQFISRQSIFMLKTQKGDVLVVGVVDSPTTTYQENNSKLPTTFSFNWIEVCDINDIKIDYIIDVDPNQDY
jgi:hypothetical protein